MFNSYVSLPEGICLRGLRRCHACVPKNAQCWGWGGFLNRTWKSLPNLVNIWQIMDQKWPAIGKWPSRLVVFVYTPHFQRPDGCENRVPPGHHPKSSGYIITDFPNSHSWRYASFSDPPRFWAFLSHEAIWVTRSRCSMPSSKNSAKELWPRKASGAMVLGSWT